MARKPPIRTCIACQNTSDKRQLVRFVRTPEGAIAFDASGKAAGRGAYVCAHEDCFKKACDKRLFDKRLRAKVGSDDYEKLNEDFFAFLHEQSGVDRG